MGIICFVPWCFLSVLDPIPAPFDQPPSQLGSLHMVTYILTWLSACINPIIYCLTNRYYREAHLELVRKLVCQFAPRSSSSAATAAFTESTNLSIPLNKKFSNLSKPETSNLSEPTNKPNIIVEKSSKDPLKESRTSAMNQPRGDLPQFKTTFEEVKASECKSRDRKQVKQVEEYELKCEQQIHLSASLQGKVKKLEDVE